MEFESTISPILKLGIITDMIGVTKLSICSITIKNLKEDGAINDWELTKLENHKNFGDDSLDKVIIGQFKKWLLDDLKNFKLRPNLSFHIIGIYTSEPLNPKS